MESMSIATASTAYQSSFKSSTKTAVNVYKSSRCPETPATYCESALTFSSRLLYTYFVVASVSLEVTPRYACLSSLVYCSKIGSASIQF